MWQFLVCFFVQNRPLKNKQKQPKNKQKPFKNKEKQGVTQQKNLIDKTNEKQPCVALFR